MVCWRGCSSSHVPWRSRERVIRRGRPAPARHVNYVSLLVSRESPGASVAPARFPTYAPVYVLAMRRRNSAVTSGGGGEPKLTPT